MKFFLVVLLCVFGFIAFAMHSKHKNDLRKQRIGMSTPEGEANVQKRMAEFKRKRAAYIVEHGRPKRYDIRTGRVTD